MFTETYEGRIKVKQVFQTKYLGKVICSDGSNTANISNNKGRGFGTVKEIINMLGPNTYLSSTHFETNR